MPVLTFEEGRMRFLKLVWAILVETFAHPLSTSTIRVEGADVRHAHGTEHSADHP